MTTTPPPFDELVSAYLDGEATDAEVARVEQSPELMAEVQRMQALTALLSSAEPVAAPPSAQREAHIAAALAAFDSTALGDTTAAAAAPSTSAEVVSLGDRRARRSLRDGRVLGIAAALAIFVLGAAALFSFAGGGSAFETADTASDAVDSASDASDSDASDSDASDGDATDSAMEDDAMEEAMADEEEGAVEAGAALMEDEAMDDEAMDDRAMEDDATEDAASDAMADDAVAEAMEEEIEEEMAEEAASTDATKTTPSAFSDLARSPGFAMYLEQSDIDPGTGESFLVGPTIEFDQLAPLLAARARPEPAPRTRCQLANPDLDANPEPTLIGLTVAADRVVEIHQLSGTSTALVLDARSCEVVGEISSVE